jgi:hypothetical protein
MHEEQDPAVVKTEDIDKQEGSGTIRALAIFIVVNLLDFYNILHYLIHHLYHAVF